MLHMRPRPPRRTGLAALCTHTCTRTYTHTHTPGGSSAGQGRGKTYSANMSLLSSHLCPCRPKVGGGGGEGGKVEAQATPGMQGLASLGQTSPASCFCVPAAPVLPKPGSLCRRPLELSHKDKLTWQLGCGPARGRHWKPVEQTRMASPG